MAETQEKNGRTSTELDSLKAQLQEAQRKNVETEQRLRVTESAELQARRVAMFYLVREVDILREQLQEAGDDGE